MLRACIEVNDRVAFRMPGVGEIRCFLEVIMVRLAKVIALSTRLHTMRAVHGHDDTRKETVLSDSSVSTTSASDFGDHSRLQLR